MFNSLLKNCPLLKDAFLTKTKKYLGNLVQIYLKYLINFNTNIELSISCNIFN